MISLDETYIQNTPHIYKTQLSPHSKSFSITTPPWLTHWKRHERSIYQARRNLTPTSYPHQHSCPLRHHVEPSLSTHISRPPCGSVSRRIHRPPQTPRQHRLPRHAQLSNLSPTWHPNRSSMPRLCTHHYFGIPRNLADGTRACVV